MHAGAEEAAQRRVPFDFRPQCHPTLAQDSKLGIHGALDTPACRTAATNASSLRGTALLAMRGNTHVDHASVRREVWRHDMSQHTASHFTRPAMGQTGGHKAFIEENWCMEGGGRRG